LICGYPLTYFLFFSFSSLLSFPLFSFALDKILWYYYRLSSSRSLSTFSPNNLSSDTMLTNRRSTQVQT
jgi:hypothetical protein